MNNIIKFTPGKITLDDLRDIYYNRATFKLDPECKSSVDIASAIVAKASKGDFGVYGVNTGFGKLANTRIAPEQTAELQRNVILSHCCGVGEPFAPAIVKLIIILKLLSLGRGASGVTWALMQQLEALLIHDIIPVIPCQGSVGASGDLAPLAHLTAAMIGEGSVIYQGKSMPAAKALMRAQLKPFVLGPKEGLGMINGTQVSTALALAGVFDAWRLAQTALICGALSVDALMASTAPFREEIHLLRGLPGQIDAARTLRQLLHGSKIREAHRENDDRIQDPYCLRCQPQVMGACMDVLRQVGATLETEANAVTDNPIVIVADGSIVSGGNFHAEPVALAADQCALAITEIGSIAERRIATTVDPTLNYGLPAFLSPDPGLNSGFMVAEVTAAALMSENKQKAAPCSIDSTPTSANQEDHVSMACHGAKRLLEMNENLANILAIELLTATQGVEFRAPLKTSPLLGDVMSVLRSKVPRLNQDRYMADDMSTAKQLVRSGEITNAINKTPLPGLKQD